MTFLQGPPAVARTATVHEVTGHLAAQASKLNLRCVLFAQINSFANAAFASMKTMSFLNCSYDEDS